MADTSNKVRNRPSMPVRLMAAFKCTMDVAVVRLKPSTETGQDEITDIRKTHVCFLEDSVWLGVNCVAKLGLWFGVVHDSVLLMHLLMEAGHDGSTG